MESEVSSIRGSVISLLGARSCKVTDNVIIDDQASATTFNTPAIATADTRTTVEIHGNHLMAWNVDSTNDVTINAWDNQNGGKPSISDNMTIGDFRFHYRIDIDCQVRDNTLADVSDSSGSTGFRLSDEATRVLIEDNDVDVDTPYYLNSFAPSDGIIADNYPPLKMDVRSWSTPGDGSKAYHDGSGTDNPEGRTVYRRWLDQSR